MNREIKFRVWDKNRNEWYLPYAFICEDGELFSDDVLKFNTPNKEITLSDDNLIIEQYTGLKDKNGKEIYEGHILNKDSHWGWYVAFEDGAFCRIPINHIQRINWEHYRMKQKDVEDWEIIGNIHENPELLEVKI